MDTLYKGRQAFTRSSSSSWATGGPWRRLCIPRNNFDPIFQNVEKKKKKSSRKQQQHQRPCVGASSRQQPIRQLNEAKCRPWFGAESVNKVETKSRTSHRKSRKFSQEWSSVVLPPGRAVSSSEFRCCGSRGDSAGVGVVGFGLRRGQDRPSSSRKKKTPKSMFDSSIYTVHLSKATGVQRRTGHQDYLVWRASTSGRETMMGGLTRASRSSNLTTGLRLSDTGARSYAR